jgi:hypothetical protein
VIVAKRDATAATIAVADTATDHTTAVR